MTKALVKKRSNALAKAGSSDVDQVGRVAMRDSTIKQLVKFKRGMLACIETADWALIAVAAGTLEILAGRQKLGQDIEALCWKYIEDAEGLFLPDLVGVLECTKFSFLEAVTHYNPDDPESPLTRSP